MLEETETEETVGFFVAFLSLMTIQLGGGGAGSLPPWLRLCAGHFCFRNEKAFSNL